jgi:hypothetical protein
MHLLQADLTDTSDYMLFLGITILVSLLIMYYIIKGAVSSANKNIVDLLQKLIDLQSAQGRVSDNNNIDPELQRLQKQLDVGAISKDVYLKKVEQHTKLQNLK